MEAQVLSPDVVFDGEEMQANAAVEIRDGKIVALHAQSPKNARKMSGVLAPGFIDTQVNGGGGLLLNHSPSVNTLRTMVKAHAQFGTTGMLPTLITDHLPVMKSTADAIAEAVAGSTPGVLGVHFEGPHLSTIKKGIHDAARIRGVSSDDRKLHERRDLGIQLLTVDPGLVGDQDIRDWTERGIRVAIGHSDSSFERTQGALRAGATGFTHLYNAMSPLTSREPGVVGAALLDPDSWCGLIVDNHHVHAASARLALRVKPRGKIMLVTDAMSTIGSTQTQFDLFGEAIKLHDGRLQSAAGTLAGSALSMIEAVNNSVRDLQLDLSEALRMASLYPAEFLGLAQCKGRIKPGYDADLVLIENTKVKATYIRGELAYSDFAA